MLEFSTNSQVLSADGETPIRLVTIHGIPYWQASGRTFPVVAGAEDPPPGDADKDKGGSGGSGGSGEEDFDKPRALATINKLRESEKAQKTELKTLKERLEQLEVEKRTRDDADKTEVEKLSVKVTELTSVLSETQGTLKTLRVDRALEDAARSANARNPSAVVRLLDRDKLELDDHGVPTNAEKLIKELATSDAYLFGKDDGPPARGNGAGPRPTGSSTTYDEVVKSEEKRLKQSGAINI